MSAKIIYSFTDENPDLQKQIGCMNGIFQLFDRQHFLTGRRSSHKRLPPVGQSGNDDKQTNETPQKAKDKNRKKEAKEKHRTSSESSRTSFSSSTCSSTFSSLDCNKIAQLEPSSTTQTISPETPSRELPMNQSKQLGRQSFDLRDVVKDSINREARGLSVNPAHKEPAGHTMKHIDSPRPLQLSKPLKPKISNHNESSRALAKLREAPWNSNEAKDSRLLASKDAPRFSYDGRESREKTAIKLKELPRLSLDSRAGSMRGPSPEFRSKYLMGNQMENENTRRTVNPQEEPGSYKRPSSVVAKLMGLDALPNSMLSNEGNMGLSKPCADQDLEPFSRSSNTANDIYQNRVSGSPRNRQQGVISPSLRNADSVMKLSSSLRIPIEPAPWKQSDGSRGSTNPASKHLESPIKTPNSCRSVYGEIEKRLAELEFRKSGKDLRALKQILEAMQKTKETLETKQDQLSDSLSQTCYSPSFSSHDHKSKLANQRNLRSTPPISSTIKQTSPLKTSGSPIVIMKPATLVRKSGNPASAIILEGLSGLHKLRTGDLAHSQGTFVDKQTSKDRTPRDNLRGTSNRFHCSTDKNFSTRIRTPETSKVPQQMTVESPTSSGRNSGALSPRLQRKQLTLEKQPRPTTPPSDSSRPRRQSSRHLIESNSQGRKIRPTSSPNLQKSDEQLSEISSSNTRCLSQQGDAISLKSESSTSFLSQVDADVSSTGHSEEIISTLSQQGGQKHKNSVARLSEDGSMAELATAATPEQPSPVSVLDAMFYKDELPSPVKKISYAFEDDETLNSDEPVWASVDLHHISDSVGSNLDIGHTKLESIEQLVQQLRQLNSPQIETSVDCITSLLENKNDDHKYISEILLASGLLSRDLASCLMTIQLQPTGYLLNPDLFLVLEQTNTKNLSNYEHIKKISKSMPKEKTHRKLIFDAVSEILVGKLVSTGSTEPWFSGNKPARRIPNGQKLLKELCSKIDQLQDSSDSSLEDDSDFIGSMLWEDLRQQSPSWTDYGSDVSGLVLDIERLIFKDLVTEVVDGEATGIRTWPNGHCRKLFVK